VLPVTTEVLRELLDALISIACEYRPEYSKEKFWLNVDREMCAKTLAKDTQIAREALKKARKAGLL